MDNADILSDKLALPIFQLTYCFNCIVYMMLIVNVQSNN